MSINVTLPIYNDEDAARQHLEATLWPNGPVCPHCGNADVTKITRMEGEAHRPGLMNCRECRKQFSVTVGTVFERSHVPLHKWVLATHLMAASKKGISAHQLHRMLGVAYRTAWFMAHRIREAMIDTAPAPLGGKGKVVEVDETLTGQAGYTFNNDDGWQSKKGRGDRSIVVALVERNGPARVIKAGSLKAYEVRAILDKNADKASILMTDESTIYDKIGDEFARHWTVNHSKGEYGRGRATTNTVEGFFSIFKRGMRGVYQHCGEQHLQRYLTEFEFRYSNRVALGVDDFTRAKKALEGAAGKRLTYRRIGLAA